MQVTRENQMIYKRLTAQESEYRREMWKENWARTEQRRDDITRYPREVVDKQVNSTLWENTFFFFVLSAVLHELPDFNYRFETLCLI